MVRHAGSVSPSFALSKVISLLVVMYGFSSADRTIDQANVSIRTARAMCVLM